MKEQMPAKTLSFDRPSQSRAPSSIHTLRETGGTHGVFQLALSFRIKETFFVSPKTFTTGCEGKHHLGPLVTVWEVFISSLCFTVCFKPPVLSSHTFCMCVKGVAIMTVLVLASWGDGLML